MTAKQFWIKSLTWGVWTWVGVLVAIFMIFTGHLPKRFGHAIYFECGKGWGGVNFGAIFVVTKGATHRTKAHEYGHAFQNIKWGLLFIPVIAIPSFIRCTWRKILTKKNPNINLPPYDSIWFEGEATEMGLKYCPKE